MTASRSIASAPDPAAAAERAAGRALGVHGRLTAGYHRPGLDMGRHNARPDRAPSRDPSQTGRARIPFPRILAVVALVVAAIVVVVVIAGSTGGSEDGSDAGQAAGQSRAQRESYCVVRAGDTFAAIAVEGDPGDQAGAAQPEPRPVQHSAPELREPGAGRVQGALRRRATESLHLAAMALRAPVGPGRGAGPRRARPADGGRSRFRRRRATAASVGEGLVPGRRAGRRPACWPGCRHPGCDRQHDEADDRLPGLRRASARRALGGASPYDPLPGESLLGLEPGERISVRDLLYGLLLASGNDAAVTLADGVAGSVPAFVEEMNGAASAPWPQDTSYANPIGLDEPGNYSSPRDLAKLTIGFAGSALFRRIFDTARTTLHTGAHPRTIVNRNQLVLDGPVDRRSEDRLHAGRGQRPGRLRHPKGRHPALGRPGGPQRSRARRGHPVLLRYGFSLYLRRTPGGSGERLAASAVPGATRRCPWSRPVPCA